MKPANEVATTVKAPAGMSATPGTNVFVEICRMSPFMVLRVVAEPVWPPAGAAPLITQFSRSRRSSRVRSCFWKSSSSLTPSARAACMDPATCTEAVKICVQFCFRTRVVNRAAGASAPSSAALPRMKSFWSLDSGPAVVPPYPRRTVRLFPATAATKMISAEPSGRS